MLNKQKLPMVALRGLVVFPHMVMHFDIGRERSIKALEKSMLLNQMIYLSAQKDIMVEDPVADDIYEIGTVAKVKQILKLPGDNIRVLVEGINRAKTVSILRFDPYLEAEVEVFENNEPPMAEDIVKEAYMRKISDMFVEYGRLTTQISPETIALMTSMDEPGRFADTVASNVIVKMEDRQALLECIDELERLKALTKIFNKEIELLKIDKEINSNVKEQIDKNQKEFFLREQIKVIQKELGYGANDVEEIDELNEKINTLPMSDEAREKASKELKRLASMSPGSPEATVSRGYVDWLTDLPWGIYTEDNLDLVNARQILDEDHYGLDKLKERIIEYLAVRKLRDDMHGPILCFVGPPGVGKTSIAHSIARALGKKFTRMSLGGVHDEAEIRGHRRTYIGSIPGRVITSIKQAGSMNPLFLFDEIDKMANDFKGDPSSAMLEVLDPEINNTFNDHYLDIPFDLSKVMFITTANDIDNIPGPLYDRMEIIEFSSYTDIEKLEIAKRHLIPKQISEHGLKPEQISVTDDAIMSIIHDYTAEAGVRKLEREIATVLRKAAVRIINENLKKVRVNNSNLSKYLGLPKKPDNLVPKENTVGVAVGLAWTAVGGQTLPVEVTVMPGTGKLELTGQLGDVMKESAKTGYSVVRSISADYGIDPDLNEKKDVHIHLPEGAVPKDGPSAGITMVSAMVSALSGRKIRCDIAMTGEITLTGRVLKIGGLKEKSLAAYRAGIKDMIVPEGNRSDVSELPSVVKHNIEFHYADNIKQVLDLILE